MPDRRMSDRRHSAVERVQILQLEHEQLYGEIGEILRRLHQIETQVASLDARVQQLETRPNAVLLKTKRT
jgi:hypothetical protein